MKKNVAEVNLDCLKGTNGNSCFKQEKQKNNQILPVTWQETALLRCQICILSDLS